MATSAKTTDSNLLTRAWPLSNAEVHAFILVIATLLSGCANSSNSCSLIHVSSRYGQKVDLHIWSTTAGFERRFEGFSDDNSYMVHDVPTGHYILKVTKADQPAILFARGFIISHKKKVKILIHSDRISITKDAMPLEE
jgi:hypothetical protein